MEINPILFYSVTTILLVYFSNKLYKSLVLEFSEWLLIQAKKYGKVIQKTNSYSIHELRRWGIVIRIREFNEK